MMKNNYIAFFLLYSFLLCDAFSTYSKQMLKGGFVVVPPVCFVTPRKSFLQVASPTSDLDENKQEKKKRLRKLKDSFKKYLITKPKSLFRKQKKNSLRNQSQVETDSTPNMVNSMDTTIVETESSSDVLKVSTIAETDISVDTTTTTTSNVEITTMEKEIPELISDMDVSSVTSSDVVATTTEDEVTHERWAYSDKNINFTGVWKIVTSDEFKKDYDLYLSRLGQPALVRSVAVNIVDFTAEDVVHDGLELTIRGKNLRGSWDRTLITSGYNTETGELIEQAENLVHTADRLETIQAESWWEEKGTVHVSWMRGVKRYGGGDFESRRYLQDNGKILVCESIFHPESNANMETKEKATIRWIFQRSE